MITFVYNNNLQTASKDMATTTILGQLFELEPMSVTLQLGNEIIRSNEDGIFEDLEDNHVYRVNGYQKRCDSLQQKKTEEVTLFMPESQLQEVVDDVQRKSLSLVTGLQVLDSAPHVSCMVQNMMLLSACASDVSLKNENTAEFKFDKLTTPRSLKASLFQIATSVSDTLRLAAGKMAEIRTASQFLPDDYNRALEVLLQVANGNPEYAEETLEVIKENTITLLAFCRECAKEVKEKFEDVAQGIKELDQALIATQGYEQKRVVSNRKEAESLGIQVEILEDQRSRLKKIEADQEQFVKKLRASYKKKVEESDRSPCEKGFFPWLGEILFGPSKQNSSANTTDRGADQPEATHQSTSPMDTLINEIKKVIKTLEKKDFQREDIKTAVQRLTTALNFVEKADDNYSQALKNEVRRALKELSEDSRASETQTHREELPKSALPKEQSEDSVALEKRKRLAEALSVAVDAFCSAMERVEVNRIEAKWKKITTAELNERRALVESEGKKLESMLHKMSEVEEKVMDFNAKLKSLNLEKVDLEQVIGSIGKAAEMLDKMVQQWSNLSGFFDALETYARTTFGNQFTRVLQGAFKAERIEGELVYTSLHDQNFIKIQFPRISHDVLAFIGCAVQLSDVCGLYTDISHEYVMPALLSAPTILSIEAEKIKDKEKKRIEIDEAYKKTKEKVKEMVQEFKGKQESKIKGTLEEKNKARLLDF